MSLSALRQKETQQAAAAAAAAAVSAATLTAAASDGAAAAISSGFPAVAAAAVAAAAAAAYGFHGRLCCSENFRGQGPRLIGCPYTAAAAAAAAMRCNEAKETERNKLDEVAPAECIGGSKGRHKIRRPTAVSHLRSRSLRPL